MIFSATLSNMIRIIKRVMKLFKENILPIVKIVQSYDYNENIRTSILRIIIFFIIYYLLNCFILRVQKNVFLISLIDTLRNIKVFIFMIQDVLK